MATPTTLYEYYTGKGQTLPSVQERAPVYQQYGLGSSSDYAGTAEQNTALLGKLLAGTSTPTTTENIVTDTSGVSTGTSPGTAGAFGLDLPENFTSEDVSNALSSPITIDDLYSKLTDYSKKISDLSVPTQAEQDLQDQLTKVKQQQNNLKAGLIQREYGISTEPISSGAMGGRNVAEERRYNMNAQTLALQEANLAAELGIETEKRTAEQTAEQVSFDNLIKIQSAINTQRQQIIAEADKLDSNARAGLDTILNNFPTTSYDELSPEAQAQINKIAMKLGIPISLIQKGMNNNAQAAKAKAIQNSKSDDTSTDKPMSLWEIQTFKNQYDWTPPYGFTEAQLMQFMKDNPNSTPQELEEGAKKALQEQGGATTQPEYQNERTTFAGVKERIEVAQGQGYTNAEIKEAIKQAYSTDELYQIAKDAGYTSLWDLRFTKSSDIDHMLNLLIGS